MKTTLMCAAAAGAMVLAAGWATVSGAKVAAVDPGDCAGLTRLPIKGGAVTAASMVQPTAGGRGTSASNAYCRVQITLKPEAISNILVEVWLPEKARWNGKFLGTGNGGAAGAISTAALIGGVNRGYAVANTDMGSSNGTNKSNGLGFGFGTGKPALQKDFSYRSTDGMTLVGKQVTEAFYGGAPKYSYFQGCSTGGYQAWEQIHRLPNEYDGVIAGAAANDRPNLHMTRIWDEAQNLRSPDATIPRTKLAMITKAATAACDQLDGVKDNIIAEPRACTFDPATIQCKGADNAECLTAPQVETLRRVYEGAHNPRTHQRVYWGFEKGAEAPIDLHWEGKAGGDKVVVSDNLMNWSAKYQKAHPNGVGFDFDKDVARVNADLSKMMNYTDPKLSKFQKAGGKVIIYHGWADGLVPSGGSPAYYERIAAANGGYDKAQGFARLFMVPGMGHCRGGAGPDQIDFLTPLENWVEKGQAPATIIASKPAGNGQAALSRPLCPYPAVARYSGRGDTNSAASFACQAPPKG